MCGTRGYLTTHVLDTVNGAAAAGMGIALFRIAGADRRLIREAITNADGRTDAPLLRAEEFEAGVYELLFHAGAYLDKFGVASAGHRFLDAIPIRFGIDDVAAHYHVPLLLSPFGYSTYRGS